MVSGLVLVSSRGIRSSRSSSLLLLMMMMIGSTIGNRVVGIGGSHQLIKIMRTPIITIKSGNIVITWWYSPRKMISADAVLMILKILIFIVMNESISNNKEEEECNAIADKNIINDLKI